MFWYLLATVLSMLFAAAAQKLKGKADLELSCGTFHYRSSYRLLAVLSFLPFFLVAAIRFEVGTDWPIYLDYYHWINDGIKSYSEQLYNLINKFVAWCIGDFQGVVVLVAFLIYFFLYRAIYDQSDSFALSVLIFFISCSFFASLSQIRQAMSMAIMLYAYKYVRERRLLPYVFWCILASSIHAISLVYLPLYFVARIRPSVRRYVTVLALFAVSLPALYLLSNTLIRLTKYAWYLSSSFNTGSEANNFYVAGFVFQLALLVIMVFYRFNNGGEDPTYDGMMNCQFLALLTLLFTPVLSQVLRVSQCFGYCQILLIPRVIDREKNRTRRIVLYILILGLYTVKMIYDTYYLGWHGVLPYQTVFTK